MTGMLPDGRYEAFAVWAEEVEEVEAAEQAERADAREGPGAARGDMEDDGAVPAVVKVDLTITTGEHKGEVVSLTAVGLEAEPLSLTGTPCTLVVEGGEPRLEP